MTPSHLSPISCLMSALLRMVFSAVQTSTRQPVEVSSCSHRSPGSVFVITTRFLPSSLCTCEHGAINRLAGGTGGAS